MALADEIAVKLGLSTTQFNQALKSAGADVTKFKKEAADPKGIEAFFDTFEHRFTSMKHIGNAVSTALGLNFEAIAEKGARLWTGVSKEEEAAYKTLGEVSSQVADANIAAMRAGLTDEKKYQLALFEREGILRRISDETGTTGVSQLKIKQEELKLAENSRIIEEHKLVILKQQNEELEKQASRNDKELASKRELQNVYENRRKLMDEIKFLETYSLGVDKEDQDYKNAQLLLASRRNQLDSANAEIRKRGTMDEKEQYEYSVLEFKAKSGLTAEESKRYETLKLISKEVKIQTEIDDLLAKSHSEKLTPAENQRLVALQTQKKVLDAQIGIINKMPDEVEKVTESVVSLTDAWKDFTVALKIKDGKSDFALTDKELDEKIQNLKKQDFLAQLDQQQNYGAGGALGFDYSPASYFTKQSLSAATAAQTERDQFRLRYSAQGEQAFAGYSAFDEQRLRGYIQTADHTKKTADSVSAIERTLQQVFPEQYRKGR